MIRILLYTAARQAVCGAWALSALATCYGLGVAWGIVAAPGDLPGAELATWFDLVILAGPSIVPVAAVVAITWQAAELRSRACGAEREAVTSIGLGHGALVGGLLLPWLPWFGVLGWWAEDDAPEAAARLTDRWVAALAADPRAALGEFVPGDLVALVEGQGREGGRVLLPASDDDCLGIAWRSMEPGGDRAGGGAAVFHFADVAVAAAQRAAVSVDRAVVRMPRMARVLGERAPAELGATRGRSVGERWRRARLAAGDADAPAQWRVLRARRSLVSPVTLLASLLVAVFGLAGRRAVAWPAWSVGLFGVVSVVALPRLLAGVLAGPPG